MMYKFRCHSEAAVLVDRGSRLGSSALGDEEEDLRDLSDRYGELKL